mmetsp:Transcript_22630/g.25190  ORF Transcript_22630/g.25190 Transcript_22630/m.25190 type:complete len:179 (-) Transcript_22630:46-582(-)
MTTLPTTPRLDELILELRQLHTSLGFTDEEVVSMMHLHDEVGNIDNERTSFQNLGAIVVSAFTIRSLFDENNVPSSTYLKWTQDGLNSFPGFDLSQETKDVVTAEGAKIKAIAALGGVSESEILKEVQFMNEMYDICAPHGVGLEPLLKIAALYKEFDAEVDELDGDHKKHMKRLVGN